MKPKLLSLIKFILLVAIFYAFLMLNIFNIGERLVPSAKDYLETNIPTEDKDLEEQYLEIGTTTKIQTGHFAANTTNDLESICKDRNICDKITFKGNFTDTEKYRYTKIISKIVDFIAKNGNQDKNIEQVINSIEISKVNGNRR